MTNPTLTTTTPDHQALIEQVTILITCVRMIENLLVQLPPFKRETHNRFKIAVNAINGLTAVIEREFDWDDYDTVDELQQSCLRAANVILQLSREVREEWLKAGELLSRNEEYILAESDASTAG